MKLSSVLSLCLLAASSLFAGCAAPPDTDVITGEETWESDVNEAFEAEPSPDPTACTPTFCCGGGVCCICTFKNGQNVCVCSQVLVE